MNAHREHMMAALKGTFVPALRHRGFVGSFPHFQRTLDNRIDFLNVQFAREGGRFYLNIGQTGPHGLQNPEWPDLTLAETTVGHLQHRSRVHWGFFLRQGFDFGPRSYDPPKAVKPPSFYEAIATRAVRAFETDGERWFTKPRTLV